MKSIRSCLFVLLAFVTLVSSRPSQAAVGAAFAAPAAVTAGLVVAGGGALYSIIDLSSDDTLAGLGALLIGIPLIIVGLIVLDEEQAVSFAPLSIAEAKELNVSQSERLAFNSEIDQVNALFVHVAEEMTASEDKSTEASAAMWNDLKGNVSAETFSTMVKISEKLHQ